MRGRWSRKCWRKQTVEDFLKDMGRCHSTWESCKDKYFRKILARNFFKIPNRKDFVVGKFTCLTDLENPSNNLLPDEMCICTFAILQTNFINTRNTTLNVLHILKQDLERIIRWGKFSCSCPCCSAAALKVVYIYFLILHLSISTTEYKENPKLSNCLCSHSACAWECIFHDW
jgi:hypothetical protein